MYLIATDGGPIAEPFETRELLLAPGGRAEVLVRGERKPGQYRLMNLPYRRFNMGMMGMQGVEFTINDMTFDPERTDTIVKVGTVEEWEIVNGGGMMMMDFDHPFHIHTNAFQVVSENDRKPRFRAWRDVVNVPVGESVRIRIPFQDFTGRTVYHCHILDHEDLGMMAVIEMGAKGA
jgi:FtsP/CotA-like multicopper oxidase with cupredoxin domain